MVGVWTTTGRVVPKIMELGDLGMRLDGLR